MSKRNCFLIQLCITAVFSALGIVLEAYLKIPFSFLEISLSFVPILICGMLSGPWWGAACAVIVDFIATIIAGRGAYFPGFAPIVFLSGVIFGLIGLANRGCKTDKNFCIFTVVLVFVNGLVCEGILKTFMICVYQVFVIGNHEMSWALFFGWFPLRIVYAVIQAALVFILALISRKQIIPKMQKVVKLSNE